KSRPVESPGAPTGRVARGPWRATLPLRPAEPAAERVPALLHDRPARPDSHHRAPPVEGVDAPGGQRRALPVARWRPPRAALRGGYLPLAALQPVRLLRG